MPSRRQFCALVALAVLLVASGCGDEGDTTATASGGSVNGSGGGAAGGGGSGGTSGAGGGGPGCSFYDLPASCGDVDSSLLFASVMTCESTETIFTSQAEWDAHFATCVSPINDPLDAHDWSTPVILFEVPAPGCGGFGTLLGVRRCDETLHVGLGNDPGCCGCGDNVSTLAVTGDFAAPRLQAPSEHDCSSPLCEDDPGGCG